MFRGLVAENEIVELRLLDFLDLTENSPLDTLSAGRCRERTIVAPELLGADTLEHLVNVEFFHGLSLFKVIRIALLVEV